ncbi:PREDICTED: flocculation protein FLO11-like [Sturnus vulgaris]|uniref:flocculation protein FLO11-like n=1 Tax=Sturnus vulgaris TaxID=9172 RepID=UPI00071A2E2E|nr:PREDICTED: flocculation protein FLO11-like [Sturnus vulgaris]
MAASPTRGPSAPRRGSAPPLRPARGPHVRREPGCGTRGRDRRLRLLLLLLLTSATAHSTGTDSLFQTDHFGFLNVTGLAKKQRRVHSRLDIEIDMRRRGPNRDWIESALSHTEYQQGGGRQLPPPRSSGAGAGPRAARPAPAAGPPRHRPGAAGEASADRPSMEGTRRALLHLAAAYCLLCALPGEGQKTGEALMSSSPFPSSALTSHLPRESSDFSPVTTAIPQTSLEKNLTAATLTTTRLHATEEDDAFIPTTPMADSKAEGLQASTAASPGDITATHPEHGNMSLSVNSSTEIPSPTLTVSTLEENQPSHEATEPFSTTEEADDASSATPTPPLNTVPATTNSSQSGLFDGQTPGSTAARSETKPGTSPVSATEKSTVEPRTSSAPISIVRSTSYATAFSTVPGTPLVTSSTPASTAAIPTSTPTLAQSLEPRHEKASVVDVGDDDNSELPSLAGKTRADPLVITVISVFIVMVGILGLVGFLRYRQHNNRMEFRRLQDLPMDDMMEDTPLSLYSY